MNRDDFINQLVDGVTDFSGADLHGVNFTNLELEGLNFKGANLSGCVFNHTNLDECNFENADLSGAILYRTSLCNTNLTNARLYHVNFSGCDCGCLRIDMDTMDKYFQSICPSKRKFIGWKKADSDLYGHKVIVKLLIPKDARRSSAFGRKCRCDKARVLSIECLREPCESGSIFDDSPYPSIVCARSIYDRQFEYELGKEVSVDNFDEDRSHECAPGIHFFMTREEAANYFI
jgi:hypothetical protein